MCLSNRNIWLIRCITKFFPGIFLQCFSVSPVVVVACDVRERWAGAPSSILYTSSGVEHQQSVGDIPGSDRLWQGGAGWLHTRHQTLGVNKSWYQEYFVTSWHFNYLWPTVLGNIPDRKATLYPCIESASAEADHHCCGVQSSDPPSVPSRAQ